MKLDPKVMKNIALINQIGLNMIIPILLCLFFGQWLDKKFDSETTFTLIGIILGLFVALRNLFVIANSFVDNKKGPKK